MSSKKDDNRRSFQQLNLILSVGMIFPVCILIGYGIGYLLDRWLGKTWITLAGLFVGCIAGFAELIRGIIQSSKDS